MMEHHDPRLKLVVVTDDLRDGRDGLVMRALAAERGGATMLLLRLKHVDAGTLVEVGRALVASLAMPVIVSERLDVALACGASGVQLTASSMPIAAVRLQTAPSFLIGGSVSIAADLPSAAQADYVTIGPVFGAEDAALGVEGFRRLALACGRPVVAIGGISSASAGEICRAGASGVAVIREVFGAVDPETAARAVRGALPPG